jgi:hypothetical protein
MEAINPVGVVQRVPSHEVRKCGIEDGAITESSKKESFQDELRRLLEKYAVDFDERYVWD